MLQRDIIQLHELARELEALSGCEEAARGVRECGHHLTRISTELNANLLAGGGANDA